MTEAQLAISIAIRAARNADELYKDQREDEAREELERVIEYARFALGYIELAQ